MENLKIPKLFSVKGLVAVITGGGTGIGRMMAYALAANGASKVFIIGRREERLQETSTSASNGSIIPVVGDVTSKESLQAAYSFVASHTDHVDLLVANSGTSGPPSKSSEPGPDGSLPSFAQNCNRFWSTPMEDFTNVSHVNVTGAFYTVLAFLPMLEAANNKRPAPDQSTISPPRPQIIITSSVGGFSRFSPAVDGIAYQLSKAAVNHMVKLLATNLVGDNIRVNGIAPGFYYTDMTSSFYKSQGVEGKGLMDGSFPQNIIPITRSGGEEDMAGLILYMAGTTGGYLNGSIIVSDGGSLSLFPSTY